MASQNPTAHTCRIRTPGPVKFGGPGSPALHYTRRLSHNGTPSLSECQAESRQEDNIQEKETEGTLCFLHVPEGGTLACHENCYPRSWYSSILLSKRHVGVEEEHVACLSSYSMK